MDAGNNEKQIGKKRKQNHFASTQRFHDSPAETTQQTPKKKNKKEFAVYGNYRNYYGYRVGQDMDEDPRLKVMKREWFEGKDCLDIGCNCGLITIDIAKKFGCRSILGIDIDGDRIEDAEWTLRKVMRTEMPKVSSQIPKSGKVESLNGLENNLLESRPEAARDSSGDSCHLEAKDLSRIVSFKRENFVRCPYPPDNTRYHAILCLSVTKWIHLNWGDDGLITLLSKVWRLLEPGGIFIVEPQPWHSYYSNRLVSETCNANYKNIQIPPEKFQDILLDKIGFRTVENLTCGLSGTKTGFNRPILAFRK